MKPFLFNYSSILKSYFSNMNVESVVLDAADRGNDADDEASDEEAPELSYVRVYHSTPRASNTRFFNDRDENTMLWLKEGFEQCSKLKDLDIAYCNLIAEKKSLLDWLAERYPLGPLSEASLHILYAKRKGVVQFLAEQSNFQHFQFCFSYSTSDNLLFVFEFLSIRFFSRL